MLPHLAIGPEIENCKRIPRKNRRGSRLGAALPACCCRNRPLRTPRVGGSTVGVRPQVPRAVGDGDRVRRVQDASELPRALAVSLRVLGEWLRPFGGLLQCVSQCPEAEKCV